MCTCRHIQEHLSEMLGPNQDMSKMSEEELQFHYFKLHDNDDNNKLDGLELIKSLIHWHGACSSVFISIRTDVRLRLVSLESCAQGAGTVSDSRGF